MVQIRLRFLILLFGLGFFVSNQMQAHAEIMFEGYYKVMRGASRVGFFIQRYEFDINKKQFTSTYFIQMNSSEGDSSTIPKVISESLKAIADDKFQPISYQYTVTTPQLIKTIDAKFEGVIMKALVSQKDPGSHSQSPSQTLTKKIPKGTFLSTFLGYLMLQKAYSVGKKFNYSAVAEEDAESYDGEAFIKDEQTFLNKKVFRILNTFKSIQFISFVTEKGEVLGTQSPLQNISTELVQKANDATQGFVLPASTLKLLFGKVPVGTTHSLAGSSESTITPTKSEVPQSKVPAPTENPKRIGP